MPCSFGAAEIETGLPEQETGGRPPGRRDRDRELARGLEKALDQVDDSGIVELAQTQLGDTIQVVECQRCIAGALPMAQYARQIFRIVGLPALFHRLGDGAMCLTALFRQHAVVNGLADDGVAECETARTVVHGFDQMGRLQPLDACLDVQGGLPDR
ncbi:hypothetical protein D9M68_140340 [compost metagenome]